MTKKGERVGAILGSNDDGSIDFLGYGTYVGDEPPIGAVGFVASLNSDLHPNPKIELDSGKIVWGRECWWGPEENIRATLVGKKINEVDIEEIRKDFLK